MSYDPKDSIKKLRILHEKLVELRESNYTKNAIIKCIEYISKIEKHLLNDNKDDSFLLFDSFCELNIIKEYNHLVSLNIKEISFALLKSLSILILSITKVQVLYLFYSNPLINQIILSNYKDEDYLSYQINFMKSLSLKLNKDTINFFYEETTAYFPLVEKTFELRSNSDGMVRNVVRNIILTLLRIGDEKINNYFISYPIVLYFANLIVSLKPKVLQLNKYNGDYSKAKDIHDDIIDSLFYIQDILSLNILKINRLLINSLLTQLIIPFANTLISSNGQTILVVNALYFLLLIFHVFKYKEVVEVIFCLLFNDKIDEAIDLYVKNNPFDEYNPDLNVVLSSDLLQDNDQNNYHQELKKFLYINSGYSYDFNKTKNDPASSQVFKVIDFEIQDNGKINFVSNAINKNLLNVIKKKDSDDRTVLLVYLLIQTAQKKEIDSTLLVKSSLLYANDTSQHDNNFMVMLDYDPDEDNKHNKKKLFLLDLLLSVLSIDMLYSPITIKVYYDLLLIEMTKNAIRLGQNRREIIINMYLSIIDMLKYRMGNLQEFTHAAYELFCNAYQEYNSLTTKKLGNIIMEPFLLIPMNYSFDISNYPSCFFQGSNSYCSFIQYLFIFMSLYDLQAKMNNQPLIGTKFPLPFEEKELEIGQKMSPEDMHHDFSECKVKQGDSLIKARFISGGNIFYVGKSTLKENEFEIMIKVPIRRAHFKGSNENSCVLLISESNLMKNQFSNFKAYELIFKSSEATSNLIQYLSQKKIEICQTEYLMLNSYLEIAGSLFF